GFLRECAAAPHLSGFVGTSATPSARRAGPKRRGPPGGLPYWDRVGLLAELTVIRRDRKAPTSRDCSALRCDRSDPNRAPPSREMLRSAASHDRAAPARSSGRENRWQRKAGSALPPA